MLINAAMTTPCLPVPLPTERELQETLIEAARLAGWLVYHPWLSVRSAAGWPDLFCVHPERRQALAFEIKSQRGRVSAAQQAWLAALTAAGIPAFVVRLTPQEGELSFDAALAMVMVERQVGLQPGATEEELNRDDALRVEGTGG